MSPRTPPGQTRDKIYEFVRMRLLEGRPPTVREVQEHFGFRAVQTAQDHLSRLVESGRLVKYRGQARGYGLPSGLSPVAPGAWLVPLLGRVQAGGLNAAIEDCEGYIAVQMKTAVAGRPTAAGGRESDSTQDVAVPHGAQGDSGRAGGPDRGASAREASGAGPSTTIRSEGPTRPLPAGGDAHLRAALQPSSVIASGLFALRVQGESMIGAGILSGDVVVVRQQPTAQSGDIVVALVDDEATVKRLRLRSGRIELHPENPAFEPIILDANDCVILGKVIEVRRYVEPLVP